MVFGDSNSFRPIRSGTSWPYLLEKKDPLHLKILNKSCDGRTTKYDSEERNGLNVICQNLRAQSPVKYVLVMLGTNDVKIKYGPPNPVDIAEGMSRILDIIEKEGKGATPIILTPPPMGNVEAGELKHAQQRISSVVSEYKQISIRRKIQLIDIHSTLETGTDLKADMIHLNAVGRHKVASTVYAQLKKIID